MERTGRNFVFNSNFFNGTKNWVTENLDIINDEYENGKNWLHIKGNAKPDLTSGTKLSRIYQTITLNGGMHVTPGKPYTVSATVRGAGEGQHIYFNMRWGRKDNSHIDNKYVGFTVGAERQTIYYTGIAPAEAYTIMLINSTNTENESTTIGNNDTNEFYVTDIKLEEGSAPSAWTPAPEDLFGRNLLRDSYVSDLGKFFNGVKTEMSMIESIRVVKGTWNSNTGSFAFIEQKEDILDVFDATPGTQYTASTMVFLPVDNMSFDFRLTFRKEGTIVGANNIKNYTLNRGWHIVNVTGGVPEAEFNRIYLMIANDHAEIGSVIYANKFKLERGTIATPWSPAPEDSPGYGLAYITRRGGASRNDITDATVTLDTSNFYFDSAQHMPKITSVQFNGKSLIEAQDYMPIITAETNVGNYEALAAGINKYSGIAKANWSITKKRGTISLEPSSVKITDVSPERVLITYEGDGELSISEGEFVRARLLPQFSYTLEENDWATIAEMAALGLAPKFWKLGDTKTFTIGDKNYHAQIIGFNHDDLSDSDAMYNKSDYNGGTNKAGITFLMVELLYDTYKLENGTNVSGGMWSNCDFRTNEIPQIKSIIGNECSSVIRTVIKKSKATNIIDTSHDELFIPSEAEMFGYGDYDTIDDGKQYAWFASGASKIKKYDTYAHDWWLRSHGSSEYGYDSYGVVTYNGELTGDFPNVLNWVALAFCI